ncbi:AMP-binding protein [Polymorphospora sp. NPDC050346]|uniref:AMP-binding protein n=1 Tax=Polymorphospora sp. NPDC050346 TaxID=3155780 RepID=UPI0033E15728
MQEPASTPDPVVARPGGTLAERVRRAAAGGPERPALVWRDQTITWGDLDARVDTATAALTRLAPATPGEPPPRVAIALPNSPEFVVSYFAALRAGRIAVPVNPAFTARELRHVLADSGATLLICTEEIRELVDGIRAELPALTGVHTGPPPVPDGAAPTPTGPTGRDEVAVLLYTSGTEGQPKGAMLTHRALMANHEQIARIRPAVVGTDDRLLLALPLFHAYGLNTGLGAVAYHGACGVLLDRFEPAEALAAITRHRVSGVVGVPSMFAGWADQPDLRAAMTSVRVAVCGAAPLDPTTARRFTAAAGRPAFVGYGLTETAPVLTATLASPAPKSGSIGQPIPGVELRLVGPDGADLWRDGATEAGEEDELAVEYGSPGTDPGEIVVRGANLFSGYWPDGHDGPDPDGWWATGDIAYADADGDLFLVDRVGELIIVNGFNVYPHEVELVLDAHPDVAESAVLGIAHPTAGQAVAAYVVRVPGSTVTSAELGRHCADRLARFKCPARLEFVDALPHSAIGKVRKTMLRSEYAGG